MAGGRERRTPKGRARDAGAALEAVLLVDRNRHRERLRHPGDGHQFPLWFGTSRSCRHFDSTLREEGARILGEAPGQLRLSCNSFKARRSAELIHSASNVLVPGRFLGYLRFSRSFVNDRETKVSESIMTASPA